MLAPGVTVVKKQRLAPNSMAARGWDMAWAEHQSRLTHEHDGVRKYTVSKLDNGEFGIAIRGGPAEPIPIRQMDAALLSGPPKGIATAAPPSVRPDRMPPPILPTDATSAGPGSWRSNR